VFAATVIVTVLLAALLSFAAVRKLSHRPHVVQEYLRVGVPERRLNDLALILLAGAAGLVLGLIWGPLGVAAAAAVACYFIVAIAFHIRAGDAEHLPTPLAIEVIALSALGLRMATL
jgi:DoxX-like family